MAFEGYRCKGIAVNGRIELEAGAQVPDGAEVVVLFDQSRKRSTAQDLLNSEIFGMWKDRDDIEDSATYARELRERAWKRSA